MILVPRDARGVSVLRHLTVFGYDDAPHGHAEIAVRGRARAGHQHAARRGPRLRDRAGAPGTGTHPPLHAADRPGRARAREDVPAALDRVAFGKPIAEQGVTLERIAESRILIDQARLLTLKAAYMMDTVGNKAARARDRHDQGRRAEHGLPGDRLGDPGARRRRRVGRFRPGATPTLTPARCASPTARTKCIATRSARWNCAATNPRVAVRERDSLESRQQDHTATGGAALEIGEGLRGLLE